MTNSFDEQPNAQHALGRPIALKPRLETFPAELTALPNWVLWKYEPPKNPNGKWRKVPYQVNGYKADTTNRHTWSPFATCRAVYEQGGYDGVGFVFDGEVGSDGTCLVGIDLDRCMETGKSKIQHFAMERIKRLDTYTEASPSGTGLHMIARTEPVGGIKTKEVEIYTTARYFTFTGRKWDEESPIRTATAEVRALIAELRANRAAERQTTAAPFNGVKIAEAFKHLKVEPLVAESDLTEHWFDELQPEQRDEVVDYALGVIANKTPFFEIQEDGGDNDQWYRLVTAVARSSAPNAEDIFVKHASAAKNPDPEDALREKFTICQKPSPRSRGITVGTLLGLAREHGADFDPWRRLLQELPAALERRARQVAENIKIGDDVTEPVLPQIMTLKEMHERLVFVGSIGVVADKATGRIRKKEHAADEYAASQHSWMQENKVKKAPALKCWIASKARMTVEVLAWVPGSPQICQPPEGQGPAFNTWRGLSPMDYPEDWQTRAEPFLEHVEFLVPIAEERERFLQWLAHIVLHPEVLPHTSYLMTTPVTGTGRNLMASILVRALRGFVAAGVSLPDLLDGGFTGRLSMKLLAIVDEAREGSGERRYQRATRLTSMVTEEHRQINPKYGHQSIQKNCCRWLYFSNYDDAIPFDPADRRNIVIANPTLRKPDAYYVRLYGLLGDNVFIGSVRHWLETRDLTSFRPGEHAPMNQAKLRVLDEMMSETERAAAEFKEDCRIELTSRDAIKDHVSTTITKDGRFPTNVNDIHLTHAIRRTGMVNTGRRIMGYKKIDNSYTAEKRFTVVIVRGEWSIEAVKRADPGKLLEAMGLKDWSATKPQR